MRCNDLAAGSSLDSNSRQVKFQRSSAQHVTTHSGHYFDMVPATEAWLASILMGIIRFMLVLSLSA